MNTANSFHIDLSYLRSVTGGDKTFEKMLLLNAVSDIQSNMNSLQGAWVEKNAVSVSTAAHTLKSVVAIAGIPPLETLCKKISQLFKDGIFKPEEESSVAAILDGWREAKPKLEEVIAMY